MGTVQKPQPAKLVLAMLAAEPALLTTACAKLGEHFSRVDYCSALIPFSHTHYYEAEFGPGLLRCFAAFERLIDPGALADIKTLTDALELEFAVQGRRRINLDPGYMTLAKYVLASTKNASHRIYLKQGIYAEVTCNYRERKWQPNPWTYRDYCSEAYLQVLGEVRKILVQQLATQ